MDPQSFVMFIQHGFTEISLEPIFPCGLGGKATWQCSGCSQVLCAELGDGHSTVEGWATVALSDFFDTKIR